MKFSAPAECSQLSCEKMAPASTRLRMRTSWVEITAGMVLSCSRTRKNCLPVFRRSMANESILQSARYVHHSNQFALVTSNPRPHIKCRSHYTALRSILKHFYCVFSWEFWAKCVRFPPLLRDTIMGWIPNRTQAKAGLWLVNIRVFTIKQLTPGFRADSGRLAVTGLPRTGPSRALRHRSVRGRFGPYGSERVNLIKRTALLWTLSRA